MPEITQPRRCHAPPCRSSGPPPMATETCRNTLLGLLSPAPISVPPKTVSKRLKEDRTQGENKRTPRLKDGCCFTRVECGELANASLTRMFTTPK
ncbi:putative disease resistance protein [Corchorus olitorius]|uniref:Disease resistance protein n=1 Tax=Corchorus olitorius TaxID=93759 RepID=A0A1R3G1U6_9ROSI|nr:putative disease resistance protein [Corchorus olitorius]